MYEIEDLELILKQLEEGTLSNKASNVLDVHQCEIIIYGAGNIGRQLFRNLKDNYVNVSYFIDRSDKIKNLGGIPVYSLNELRQIEINKEANVILSALFTNEESEQIKLELRALGFKSIFCLDEINLSKMNQDIIYDKCYGRAHYIRDIIQEQDKIRQAFLLLEREVDRELFIKYLKSHLSMDFREMKDYDDEKRQYLGDGIQQDKDYSFFVDCGAYNGDTIRRLKESNSNIKDIVAFEPQNDLCDEISKYVKEHQKELGQVVIFPCAVYSKIEKLKFEDNDAASTSARLSEDGDESIQCVNIDNVLHGIQPTFIKMDVEGSEIEALKGARKTIINNKPQLAICVYHNLSDLWNIPLLISSFYTGYKFYMKCYSSLGLETVLYAFPDSEKR